MVPAIYVSCEEMITKWEEGLKKESSCEVDVWPYLQTLSSDVISRTAFGSSFEEGKRIFELQRELAELVIHAIQSIYIPGSRYLSQEYILINLVLLLIKKRILIDRKQICRFLPTKNNKRMKKIDQDVKDSIRSIIDKRIMAMKAGESSKDDLLGILLDSNYKEIKQHGNRNFGLTIDEVIEECKLFYFAGQETTGNLLVWTMILLGQHKHWQERAREEVSQIFGKKKPEIDGLNRLKIVSLLINEVN